MISVLIKQIDKWPLIEGQRQKVTERVAERQLFNRESKMEREGQWEKERERGS